MVLGILEFLKSTKKPEGKKTTGKSVVIQSAASSLGETLENSEIGLVMSFGEGLIDRIENDPEIYSKSEIRLKLPNWVKHNNNGGNISITNNGFYLWVEKGLIERKYDYRYEYESNGNYIRMIINKI